MDMKNTVALNTGLLDAQSNIKLCSKAIDELIFDLLFLLSNSTLYGIWFAFIVEVN